jgi:hypothetical protein
VSAAQYKNRKNLHAAMGTGVPAELHFFIASHVKSAYDVVGGTLKMFAAEASLQQPYNDQIMTSHQLYHWTQSNIYNLNFDFVTENG